MVIACRFGNVGRQQITSTPVTRFRASYAQVLKEVDQGLRQVVVQGSRRFVVFSHDGFSRVMTKSTRAAYYLSMKPFHWSADNNDWLKRERGVSFEQMVVAINAGGLLDVLAHPKPAKYPGRRVMVVEFAGYVYLVPLVEAQAYFFLKTIIPSRKATRDYLTGGKHNESN